MAETKIKVLFVCMGNLCRSPMAEGVFGAMVETYGLGHRVAATSAGTHSYSIGSPPDPRAQRVTRARGIELGHIRSSRIDVDDFLGSDYLIAMDRDNLQYLMDMCPAGYEDRVKLFLSFAPELGRDEIPDPYYGAINGFEVVLDLVEAASRGLLEDIRFMHGL